MALVPRNYVCVKCKSTGNHWIQDCNITKKQNSKHLNPEIDALSYLELHIIFSYCPFTTLLYLNVCCQQFHDLIKASGMLVKQVILQYYQTTFIDSTIENNHCDNKEQNELDIDLNFKINNQPILPIFDPICHNQLKLFHSSKLFQLYSRLISYNWKLHLTLYNTDDECIEELTEPSYGAPAKRGPFIDIVEDDFNDISNGYNPDSFHNLDLLHIHHNIDMFRPRELTDLEKYLFKYNDQDRDQQVCDELLVNDFETFKDELREHFYYDSWRDLIFPAGNKNAKFFLAGGSVLKCISKYHHQKVENNEEKKMKDLDLFAIGIENYLFRREIFRIKLALRAHGYKVVHGVDSKSVFYHKSCVENLFINFANLPSKVSNKLTGKDNEIIIKQEGFWTQMQFIWIGEGFKPWSILHIFDLDCCQVGFDGDNVVSKFAFLQSITTNTMINYKLLNNSFMKNTFLPRTKKYSKRGFQLIVPHNFNFDTFINSSDNKREKNKSENINKKRGKVLQKLFIHFESDVGVMYGEGGFGLNNDCLGVRRRFIEMLQDLGGTINMNHYKPFTEE